MLYEIHFYGTRVTLPLALQQTFEPLMRDHQFIVTANLDRAISIFPMDEWDNIVVGIQRLPTINAEVRQIQRLIIGNAVIIQQTSTGEIDIPQQLKQYAGIRKKAAALAFDHKIEIWNPESLNIHLNPHNALDYKQFIAVLRGTVEEVDPTLLDRLYPAAVVTKPSNSAVGKIDNNGKVVN